MFVDNYILQISRATHNELLIGLYDYRYPTFLNIETEDYAGKLAAAVAMSVIGEPASEKIHIEFREQNAARIKEEVLKFSKDEKLCEILSGAAYNIGYGRYVASGGNKLINRFLGYIRADARKGADFQLFLKMRGDLYKIDPTITLPIETMTNLGIWRARPHNPNEKEYYQAVQTFRQANAQLKEI